MAWVYWTWPASETLREVAWGGAEWCADISRVGFPPRAGQRPGVGVLIRALRRPDSEGESRANRRITTQYGVDSLLGEA